MTLSTQAKLTTIKFIQTVQTIYTGIYYNIQVLGGMVNHNSQKVEERLKPVQTSNYLKIWTPAFLICMYVKNIQYFTSKLQEVYVLLESMWIFLFTSFKYFNWKSRIIVALMNESWKKKNPFLIF